MEKIEIVGNEITRNYFDYDIAIEVTNPLIEKIIEQIEIKDIVSYSDNEKLFKAIIENDEEILHDYLTKSGYVFNKA